MYIYSNYLIRYFTTFFILLFISQHSVAQNCNAGVTISPNKASYCAGEPITVKVNNPANNFTYRIVVNGVTYEGTEAIISLPGATTTRSYDINILFKGAIGNFTSCQPIVALRPKLTIDPSPDPTITDISTNQTAPFTKCAGSAPYTLDIQNGSTTASNFTQTYNIDWGDGTSTGNINTFTTLSHNYSASGEYKLKVTVSTSGLSSCNSVTKEYNAYFGGIPVNPGIGKATPGIACIPENVQFILNGLLINQNTPGTYYDFYISGKLDTTMEHPASLNYFHLFDKTSCGEGSCSQPDAYEVKLIVRNQCASSPSATVCYQVNEKPDPKIQLPDTVCINEPTPHINQTTEKQVPSTGGACIQPETQWKITPNTGWTLNSGNMNTSPTINVTYNQLGTFKVDMTVKSNSCGDSTISKNVVVVPKPTASFTLDQNKICGGNIITATNTSVNDPVVKYQWSITPATGWVLTSGTLNSNNISIRFNNKGNYNIQLRAYVSICDDVVSQNVAILDVPSIDTNVIPPVCTIPFNFDNTLNTISTADDHFIFDNGNDNNATFSWIFNNGTPATSNVRNPGNILYNSVGTYGIFAQITNQCGFDSITLPISLYNFPKPNAGPDFSICLDGLPIQLSGFSPAGGVWSGTGITDVVNGVFNPANAGGAGKKILTYTINQTSVCPTSDIVEANVIEIVGLNAGNNQEICKGSGTLQLSGESIPGGNWFGVGNAIGKVTSAGILNPVGMVPGTYQVGYTIQDASGTCRDTAYKDVLVKDSIHFIPPTDKCIGIPINFGQISDNIVSPTQWNFGDGSPPSFLVGPNVPPHAYTSTGIKTVTLNYTTNEGCTGIINFPVNVIQTPPISFNVTPSSSCDGNVMISFPPTHVELATQYDWYYNNQNQSKTDTNRFIITLPQPVLADSTYQITLIAKYTCGDASTAQLVTIESKPRAGFNVQSSGCSPFNPILTNAAYGGPTNYIWDFGNGQLSNLPNPTPPTYTNTTSSPITYTITQTVSKNSCVTDKVSKVITVLANNTVAKIDVDKSEGCVPLDIIFESISSGGSIDWNFGDGTTGFSSILLKQYTTPGTYKVVLNVNGCGPKRDSVNITVHPSPTVDFTASNQCLGTPTQFTSTTTNTSSRTWEFGDNPPTFSSLQNPTKTYSAIGNYDVKLTAYSNKGCEASITKTITINNQPKADFTVEPNKICLGKSVTFINSTVSQGAPVYTWTLGDGNTSNSPGPINYTYAAQGTYTVSLIAQEGDCKSTKTVPSAVRVFPNPIADFDFTIDENQKFKAPVLYNNLSSFADEYLWVFRAGDSSSLKDPSFLYGGVGPYKTTLYVENANNCKDTITKILAVDFEGAVYTPNAFAPELGEGTNESSVFKPKGVDLKEYHVQVYSTYGQLLWESTALVDGRPSEAWDGRYKGELMPQDVYVWKIRAIFKSGKAWEGMLDEKTGRKTTMGHVLLIR